MMADAYVWDGKIYDQSTGEEIAAPDGDYTYRLIGTLYFDGAHKVQTLDMPIKIDTTKPTITNAKIADGKLSFDYADTGVGFTTKSNIYLMGDQGQLTINLGNDGEAMSGHFESTLDADEMATIQSADGNLQLMLEDAAGNQTTATTPATIDGTAIAYQAPTFAWLVDSKAVGNPFLSIALDVPLATMQVAYLDEGLDISAQIVPAAGAHYFVSDFFSHKSFEAYKVVGDVAYFHIDNTSALFNEALGDANPDVGYDGGFILVGIEVLPGTKPGEFIVSRKNYISMAQYEADGSFVQGRNYAEGTEYSAGSTLAKKAFDASSMANSILGMLSGNTGTPTSLIAGESTVTSADFVPMGHDTSDLTTAVAANSDYISFDHLTDNTFNFLNAASPVWDAATKTVTISGKVTAKTDKLVIYGNSSDKDDPANQVALNADGTFSYSFQSDGTETIPLGYLITPKADASTLDSVGKGVRGRLQLVLDTELPQLDIPEADSLTIDENGDYILGTTSPTLTFEGKAQDNAEGLKFFIGDDMVYRGKNGEELGDINRADPQGGYDFSKTFTLNPGTNYLTFKVVDQTGNTTTKVFKVEYRQLQQDPGVFVTAKDYYNSKTAVDEGVFVTAANYYDNRNQKAGDDNDLTGYQAGYDAGYRQGKADAQAAAQKAAANHGSQYDQGYAAGFKAGQAAAKAGAKTTKTAAKAAAKATKAAAKGTKAAAKSDDDLPQAGESQSSLGLLGAALLASIAAAFGFGKKRRG